MRIIKKKSNDFSLVFIYLNAFVNSRYKNEGLDRLQWLYPLAGEAEINYEMNGYQGCYQLSTGILADLRPIADLDTSWKSSESSFLCIGFISQNTQDCYEAEVLSIPEKNKEFFFDRETIGIVLSYNVYLNDKEIANESVFRTPANRTINCRCADDNGILLIFYKNDE